jgi:hypothetical protein
MFSCICGNWGWGENRKQQEHQGHETEKETPLVVGEDGRRSNKRATERVNMTQAHHVQVCITMKLFILCN